jgi:DNA polymerase I-like protein with 3'-5' exonuclease and polymerase domains
VKYHYLREPGRELDHLGQKLQEAPFYGFDVETTGLDHLKDKVILASFTLPDGETYLVDTRSAGFEPMRAATEREEISKLGVNLTFDYMLTKGSFGCDLEGCIDLMLGERVLTAGLQFDGAGLAALTQKYLGKDRDKTLQKSFINHIGEFTQGQLDYAAEDTADLILLGEKMKAAIKEDGLSKVWMTENRAIPAFADIQFYGQKINEAAWRAIMEENLAAIGVSEKELARYYEPFFDIDLFGEYHINYKSQPTILYGLQKMGIQVDGHLIDSTDDENRKKVGNLPVMLALDDHREAVKLYGTYGQSYLDAIHALSGRIHPRMNQCGTETGRPTCRKPSVLNVPRPKKYREAFITDFGRLLSTVDFSQAELRILAERSGEPLMIKGFNSGIDFHCFVAAMLTGRASVAKSDPIRQPIKTVNFMLAYGGGPGRLQMLLRAEGIQMTLEECKTLFYKYKETFKVAIAYLETQKKEARLNLVMRDIVGRKRHWIAPNQAKLFAQLKAETEKKRDLKEDDIMRLNEVAYEKMHNIWAAIEREGANFCIQAENQAWTKEAMYEIRKECKRRHYDARMYNSVYDEIVLDCDEKDAEAAHELQKRIMIECGSRYLKRVPVEVDGHLKPYWTK